MSKPTMIALAMLCFLTGHVGIVLIGFLLLSTGLLMPSEQIRKQMHTYYEARMTEAQEGESDEPAVGNA
jgi:hypothetical protein